MIWSALRSSLMLDRNAIICVSSSMLKFRLRLWLGSSSANVLPLPRLEDMRCKILEIRHSLSPGVLKRLQAAPPKWLSQLNYELGLLGWWLDFIPIPPL
jgi:hypothetical protein